MENKPYQLRYLPLFERDLISTANYITNVLKNEDAALHLIDDQHSSPFSARPSSEKRSKQYISACGRLADRTGHRWLSYGLPCVILVIYRADAQDPPESKRKERQWELERI